MPDASTVQAGPHGSGPGLDFSLAYTESGTGPTLLLIHGSLCDYRYWRPQLNALGARYRVVAPSLRGYWPRPYTQQDSRFNVGQHAQDLLAFMQVIGQGDSPVHVLGHSRGAHVALEMASRQPSAVASLILADPGFQLEGESNGYDYLSDAAIALDQGDAEGALQRFIDSVNGEDTWRKMVAWFKTMARDNAPTLLSQTAEADRQFDMSRAERISCPVLLLGGRNSPVRYARIMDALQPHLRNVQRDTIPLAAHGMNLANPRTFNARVMKFLDALNG